ncbi:MAG: hypothetical protein KZQ90_12965 [Candidatus Thiodiazotropha sp. (ex Codakia rugifera)]|nr:hypothetical protein [Candidatus Thiodiazotropha sp. (ex Codakia rugifera)]
MSSRYRQGSSDFYGIPDFSIYQVTIAVFLDGT